MLLEERNVENQGSGYRKSDVFQPLWASTELTRARILKTRWCLMLWLSVASITAVAVSALPEIRAMTALKWNKFTHLFFHCLLPKLQENWEKHSAVCFSMKLKYPIYSFKSKDNNNILKCQKQIIIFFL